MWLSIVATMTLLTGCTTVSSRVSCPPLVTYSAEFQKQTAEEFSRAGENIRVLVTDYGKLRDACRVI